MTVLAVVTSMGLAAVSARAQARASMELLETKATATAQNTLEIVGQVKNISTRPVSGVTVYCDLQDANGKSLRVVQGHLETDPLPADKISQFKLSAPYSAEIKRFNVTFGQMFGGALVTKDSRKQ
jgi:hypothetical protein